MDSCGRQDADMAHHSADATLTGLTPVIEPGSVTIGVAIAIAFLLWVGEMGETIFNKEACC